MITRLPGSTNSCRGTGAPAKPKSRHNSPCYGRMMDRRLTQALQQQLDRCQKLAPCLGSNVTITHARHGTWSGAPAWLHIEIHAPMPVGSFIFPSPTPQPSPPARLPHLPLSTP